MPRKATYISKEPVKAKSGIWYWKYNFKNKLPAYSRINNKTKIASLENLPPINVLTAKEQLEQDAVRLSTKADRYKYVLKEIAVLLADVDVSRMSDTETKIVTVLHGAGLIRLTASLVE